MVEKKTPLVTNLLSNIKYKINFSFSFIFALKTNRSGNISLHKNKKYAKHICVVVNFT